MCYTYITLVLKCELMKSSFKDDITAYLDSKGNVVGISYSSPLSPMARPCDAQKVKFACVNSTISHSI